MITYTNDQMAILNKVMDLCLENNLFPLGFIPFHDLNQTFKTEFTDQEYKSIFEDYWHQGVEEVEIFSLTHIGFHAEDMAYPNSITY